MRPASLIPCSSLRACAERVSNASNAVTVFEPKSDREYDLGNRSLVSCVSFIPADEGTVSRIGALTRRYGSDRALGVRHDREMGIALLPDGEPASVSGHCARYIRSQEPDTAIYGFWSRDNPSWAGAALQDGHDFAVVDSRYIVDPWVVETEALSKRAVLDLENPAHAKEIRQLYGNPLKWSLMAGPSGMAERAGSARNDVLRPPGVSTAAKVRTSAERAQTQGGSPEVR